MKRLIALSTIFTFVNSFAFCQSLTGITWEGHQGNQLIGYYKFNSTSMEYSQSGSGFSTVANLTLAANSLTITDVPTSGACTVTDVGIYNFSFITNDVVKFTLLSDPCLARKNAFSNFLWMREGTTGIIGLLTVTEVKSLGQNEPNPFSDKTRIDFFIPKSAKESFLIVNDMSGREVVKYTLDKYNNYIEIYPENLREGIYFYTLVCDGQASPFKRMIVAGH